MKILKTRDFKIVKAGKDLQIVEPFKIQSVIEMMEKNESYIFWIQLPNTKTEEQIATVRINGQMYNLNMKLEKAIFRHIRLTKNFCNLEILPDGTHKLRIPHRLFNEKIRTSNRFEVIFDFDLH